MYSHKFTLKNMHLYLTSHLGTCYWFSLLLGWNFHLNILLYCYRLCYRNYTNGKRRQGQRPSSSSACNLSVSVFSSIFNFSTWFHALLQIQTPFKIRPISPFKGELTRAHVSSDRRRAQRWHTLVSLPESIPAGSNCVSKQVPATLPDVSGQANGSHTKSKLWSFSLICFSAGTWGRWVLWWNSFLSHCGITSCISWTRARRFGCFQVRVFKVRATQNGLPMFCFSGRSSKFWVSSSLWATASRSEGYSLRLVCEPASPTDFLVSLFSFLHWWELLSQFLEHLSLRKKLFHTEL